VSDTPQRVLDTCVPRGPLYIDNYYTDYHANYYTDDASPESDRVLNTQDRVPDTDAGACTYERDHH